MLFEVLLQGILLGYDLSVVVVPAVVEAQRGAVGQRREAIPGGSQRAAAQRLVLAVLDIIQLLVGEAVQAEVWRGGASGPPLPRAEAQHGAHSSYRGCGISLHSH